MTTAAAPAAPVVDRRPHGERFRGDVEGLRGVAIVAVVLYHAEIGAARGGYVGVDVFFVVSGFLITRLLWRELEETGSISFRSFYARRARRLLPAGVLVVVATLAASVLWLAPLRAADVAKDAAAVSVYAGNYRFALQETDYLDSSAPPSPLLHYWSLGVEEQFYACWPLILFAASLAWRRRSGPASATPALVTLGVVAGVSLIACVVVTDVAQPWAFFSLPTRAWELALGGLVALAEPALRRLSGVAMAVLGWSGMAAIGWSVAQLGPSTAFPGAVALIPVTGTAAVVAAGCASPRWGPGALLDRRPVEAVGRVSYSWYLWHWPVLVLAPAVAGRALGPQARLGLAVASVVPAVVTLHLVENPVRFSSWLSWRPRRGLALGAGLTAVSLVAAGITVVSLPSLTGSGGARSAALTAPPSPSAERSADADVVGPEQARFRAATATVNAAVVDSLRAVPVPSDLDPPLRRAHADRARPFVDGCHLGFTAAAVRDCNYGASGTGSSVFLFGDSHATHWFPALKAAADERGWRLVSLTKSTCPPVAMPLWSPDLGRSYRECDTWRDGVLTRIRAERPAAVVIGAARHYGPEFRFDVRGPAWTTGLGEMVRRIEDAGSRAVVLGPAPHPGADVPDCLSEHLGDVAACSAAAERAVDRRHVASEEAAVARAGGAYVDVTPWFCDATRCSAVVGNLLVYRDDNHLTTAYAAWLAPVVGAALDASRAKRATGAGGPG